MDGVTARRPVVPRGQEAVLRRLLTIEPAASGGWTFEGCEADAHVIRARYAHPRSGAAVLELGHPSHSPGAAATTERFGIAFAGALRPTELLEAVRARVASHEAQFAWHVPVSGSPRPRPTAPPRIGFAEIERVALLAGAKPALRASVHARDIERVAAELEGAGFRTARFRSRLPPRTVLLVAPTIDEATRLWRLERAISRDVLYRSRRCVDAARELGLRLGYPRCCVERFVERYRKSSHPLLPRPRSLAFVAASEAWVPRPSYLLNDLIATTGSAYVSFEPCRYDCQEALRAAARVAEAVAAHDPALSARIDEELRRDVLVLASGQRAVVVLRAGGARAEGAGGPRIATDYVVDSLAPLPAPERVVRHAEDLTKLRGARVDERGRVVGRDDALIIRFGSAATPA